MKLFGNGGGSWGLTVLETDPDFGTSRALFGICGDSGTGSIWLLFIFMNFTIRNETEPQSDSEKIPDITETICPVCDGALTGKWSGVECGKCGYWECF